MKLAIVVFCLCVGFVFTAPTEPKDPKEGAAPAVAAAAEVVVPKEAPLQGKNAVEGHDASSVMLKIPVDNANKLLYDLDATVKQLFDDSTELAKEEKSDDLEDPQVYSAANRELDFYPRQTEAHQQATLVTQLENLEKRLLNTINELQTRRRYFSSTMLRQMYNSVHRIRVNIARVQTQFSSPQQSVAAPSPARPPAGQGMMNQLQQRVSDIQKAVNDIINRVTSTFQGPNAQKPPAQAAQSIQF